MSLGKSQLGAGAPFGATTHVRVRKSVSQSIAASTGPIVITWQTEKTDTLGEFGAPVDTFAPNIPAGETWFYASELIVGFNSNMDDNTSFLTYLYKNGGFLLNALQMVTAANAPLLMWTHDVEMTTGDTLQARIFHTNGSGPRTIPNTDHQAQWNIWRINEGNETA